MIPQGSVVDSHLFFSGQIEISLAKYNRFVCARTTQYVIFEFWKCLLNDSKKIYDIISSEHFKFEIDDYAYLQEKWAHFKDEYIRSSFFYLLNNLSDTGGISSGNLVGDKINNIMLANLKTFKKPTNFHLIHDKKNFIDSLKTKTQSNYKLINVGNYVNDLFIDGFTYGLEDTRFYHNDLFSHFENTRDKTILLYKFKKEVIDMYKEYNTQLIDVYGRPTTEVDKCKEVIIANF